MAPYIVHGLTRSYFTRKVTGYLDYTDRPWRLEPCPPTLHPAATEAGWTGGIPVVTAPDDRSISAISSQSRPEPEDAPSSLRKVRHPKTPSATIAVMAIVVTSMRRAA